jgi:hypothetical protein
MRPCAIEMTGARLFVSSSGTLTTCRDLCYSAEPAYGGWPMIEIHHKETGNLLLQIHEAKGLETIQHRGLSSLDIGTLRTSVHALPDAFLLKVGYSEAEIHSWRTMYPSNDRQNYQNGSGSLAR